MASLRVLLVDDNLAFLGMARRELASDTRIQLVGYAHSAEEALAQMPFSRPDLVLLDIALPRMNGLEATRQIKTRLDAPRVVLVTSHNTLDYRVAGLAAGADGFIAKEEFDTQLAPLIEMLFGDLLHEMRG